MFKLFIYFKDGTIPVRGCPHIYNSRREAEKNYKYYNNRGYDVELRNKNNKTLKWTNINWVKAGLPS